MNDEKQTKALKALHDFFVMYGWVEE